jgi:hypothetical protein
MDLHHATLLSTTPVGCSQYCISSNCFSVAAWRCALSYTTRVTVPARRTATTQEGKCQGVIRRNVHWEMDWAWRVHCIASSVALPHSIGYLPLGTLEEHVHADAAASIKISQETSLYSYIFPCRHVVSCTQQNTTRCTTVCLEMHGARFEHIVSASGKMWINLVTLLAMLCFLLPCLALIFYLALFDGDIYFVQGIALQRACARIFSPCGNVRVYTGWMFSSF